MHTTYKTIMIIIIKIISLSKIPGTTEWLTIMPPHHFGLISDDMFSGSHNVPSTVFFYNCLS